MLYTQGKRLWTFALKTDLLVEMLLLFRYEFRAAFTVENIYDNKRNDIYYWENLNSSNYDKQDFEKRLNKILMLMIENNGNNYTGYYTA